MSVDFNNAEPQGAGAGVGPIPEDSIVMLRMTLRAPKAGKTVGSHPLFTKSEKGNESLDVEFDVPTGKFEGKKLWQNFVVVGVGDGGKTAANISMRTLRAIVEAWRGVLPDDQTPAACAKRQLADWPDLQGAYFPAKVGVEISKDGRFVNNTIKKIITPEVMLDGTNLWQLVMAGAEIITDKPLPVAPNAGQPSGATAATASGPAPAGAPTWGAGSPGVPPAAGPAVPTPSWAKK